MLKTDGEITRPKFSLFNCSGRLTKKLNVLNVDDDDDDDAGQTWSSLFFCFKYFWTWICVYFVACYPILTWHFEGTLFQKKTPIITQCIFSSVVNEIIINILVANGFYLTRWLVGKSRHFLSVVHATHMAKSGVFYRNTNHSYHMSV